MDEYDTILAPAYENEATLLEGIIDVITPVLNDDSFNEEQTNEIIEVYRETFPVIYFRLLSSFFDGANNTGVITHWVIDAIHRINPPNKTFILYYNEARERVEKSSLKYSATKATFTPSENVFYPFAVITDFNGVNETKLHATSIPYDPKNDAYPTIVKTTSGEEVSYSLSESKRPRDRPLLQPRT